MSNLLETFGFDADLFSVIADEPDPWDPWANLPE